MRYYVYMLSCKDGSLYTGSTNNYQKRISKHQKGKGARYTNAKGVEALVYLETLATKSAALKREASIKKLPRGQKLQLIRSTILPPL